MNEWPSSEPDWDMLILCAQENIPFAVVGTDKEHQVNGNKVLGRKTKWGIIEGKASVKHQWNLIHTWYYHLLITVPTVYRLWSHSWQGRWVGAAKGSTTIAAAPAQPETTFFSTRGFIFCLWNTHLYVLDYFFNFHFSQDSTLTSSYWSRHLVSPQPRGRDSSLCKQQLWQL